MLHTRVHYLRAREQTCVLCCCRSASQTRHCCGDKEEDKSRQDCWEATRWRTFALCIRLCASLSLISGKRAVAPHGDQPLDWHASKSIWPPGGAFSKSSSQSDLVVEHFLGIAPRFIFIIYFIHVFVRRKIYNDSSWLNVTSLFSVSYMKEGRCSNTKLQIQVVVAALKAIVCRTRCVFSYGGSHANGRIAVAQHWHVVWCLFCSWLASDGSYESINESAEMRNRSSHFQIRSPNRFHWFANCQNE